MIGFCGFQGLKSLILSYLCSGIDFVTDCWVLVNYVSVTLYRYPKEEIALFWGDRPRVFC